MKIGLTQMNIVWENKERNMDKVRELVQIAVGRGVELLVFPEMTLTGFTMNAKLVGESMLCSPTVSFFKELSIKNKIAIAFGFVESFDNEFYNKLVIVSEGEIIYDYNKIHPFNYGEEGKYYSGGNEVKKTFLNSYCISGFICYDLRFPEIFQVVSKEAEVILVIANWPKERSLHWKTLLQARAIENQCYVVGVNRTGRGNGLEYKASSVAFDPLGESLINNQEKSELIVIDVDNEKVKNVREQFPFRLDRKQDLYKRLY